MGKLLIYPVIFLLLVSLILAVDLTITTNLDDFDGDDLVSITINGCLGTSIAEITNPTDDLVDIKTGNNNWFTTYNTLSDSADGKYKITVTCTNGAASKYFCVDDDGCLVVTPPPAEEEEGEPAPSPEGGGGVLCTTKWVCSAWSYCGSELIQTRICTDKNKCASPKTETRDCLQCEESWVCSVWSDCLNGANERNCYDEHKCGTASQKPSLKKSCTVLDAGGIQPKQISTKLPPPYAAPKKSVLEQFWNNYGIYLVLGLGILVLLIVIIVLSLHFLKSKKKAYNIDELKQWVQKESAMGTSIEDIRALLTEHTGWRKEEIDAVMKDFSKPGEEVSKPAVNGRMKVLQK